MKICRRKKSGLKTVSEFLGKKLSLKKKKSKQAFMKRMVGNIGKMFKRIDERKKKRWKLILKAAGISAVVFVIGVSVFIVSNVYSAEVSPAGTNIYYSGNKVGIGIASPAAKLHIFDNADGLVNLAALEYGNNVNNGATITFKTSGVSVGAIDHQRIGVGNYKLRFNNWNGSALVERMYIGQENMVIKSNKVGIGTESPEDKLSVGNINIGSNFGSGFEGVWLNGDTSVGNYNILSHNTDKHLYINRPSGYAIGFRENNGTNQMYIGSGGKVGIGTEVPTSRMQVYENSAGTRDLLGLQYNSGQGDGASLYFKSGSTPVGGIQHIRVGAPASGDYKLSFLNWDGAALVERMYIGKDGKVRSTGGYACASDSRLKKNVRPIENSLAKVLNLSGVSFQWLNNNDNKSELGFVAQAVEKVAPELVENDADGYKTLNYDGVSALLVDAVKEQQANIDNLVSENQALKQRIEKLERGVSGD